MTALPDALYQAYSELYQRIGVVQAIADASLATPATFNGSALYQSVQAVQQQFQQRIAPPATTLELPPRAQSIQTEINRHLRLLTTDVAFLRSARQAHTQQQRLQQVRDRLIRLTEFCDALLSPPVDSQDSEESFL